VKGERLVFRQDDEMQCLLHVTKLPQRLVDRQDFRVVGTVFLFCRTQFPGEEGEGLLEVLSPLYRGRG
jgi:hypothetical protein